MSFKLLRVFLASSFNCYHAGQWEAEPVRYSAGGGYLSQVRSSLGESLGMKRGWSVLPLTRRWLLTERMVRRLGKGFLFHLTFHVLSWSFLALAQPLCLLSSSLLFWSPWCLVSTQGALHPPKGQAHHPMMASYG